MQFPTIQGHDIKTNARVCDALMTAQPTLGRTHHTSLFMNIDGLYSRAETRGPSGPNLDKDQYRPLPHHQIEFSDSKACVTVHDLKALRLQIPQGRQLGSPALLLCPWQGF